MPSFSLAGEARRQRNIRRKSIILPEIAAPAMMATDLYRSTYLPVINLWMEAAKRISAEYERTLTQMTTDAPSDVQGEIEAADAAFSRLLLTLTPSLRDWAIKVERMVRTRWARQIYSATSVDLTTRLSIFDVEGTVESYIAWNVDLVRDVSDQVKKRIADRVFSGLTQRKPARQVAKEIREAVEMSRRRALNIAADQSSKMAASLAAQRREDAGLEVFQWHHSGKLYPRQHHVERNGRLYSENPALVGKKVGGNVVRQAPPRGDRAGMAPWCGCRERGVLVFEFDEVTT